MRSVIAFQSSTWLRTISRQRALNSAIPNFSMSAFEVKPSSASSASSTGSPWQSQPPLRSTKYPHIVR